MQIIDKENLALIVGMLREGKVVVFPSETSYGLSCDAANQEAVNQIFAIKGRPSDKALLIVVSSVEMAKKYLEWNTAIDNLAKKYWPGPLTIVGKATVNCRLALGALASDGNVAVRVTSYEPLVHLIDNLEEPVVSTSANVSGQEPLYKSKDIVDTFSSLSARPHAFYDVGDLPARASTTIVKVVKDEVEILRKGDLQI